MSGDHVEDLMQLEDKVRELHAENEWLTDQRNERDQTIVALKQLCRVEPSDLIAVGDENERMRKACKDMLAHLKAGTSFSLSACEWCDDVWPKCDNQTREVTAQVAREHLYRCAKHPLRLECESLRAEVRRLQQLIIDET